MQGLTLGLLRHLTELAAMNATALEYSFSTTSINPFRGKQALSNSIRAHMASLAQKSRKPVYPGAAILPTFAHRLSAR
jgi:hypothetical protein